MPKSLSPRQHFEAELKTLVAKFDRDYAHHMSAKYNEAEVRAEFIDEFFAALGWDMLNRGEREVVREKTETSGRFDYQFQLKGRPMFIVEAKAPHVSLESSGVIMQAKKYAWNSREVSIAAITDFEEFRLYDATVKPDPKHPDVGLIFAHKYVDYLNSKSLDDLWLLSKESVEAGSIDRLLKMSSVKGRERIPVDQSFLDDLTEWRTQLAKAVFKIEPDIEPADLNSAVQVFLDRLIFIRFAEDHTILPLRGLEDIARTWERSGRKRSIVNDLNALFHEVNDVLNGEIFKFHRSEKIDWDQEAALVAKIIQNLYDGPYRFDVIGVELLGSIYERYLGKTIRVTATRAVVEEKPEVRKAGGVYYTPKYIVDYIVDQTVGKLIEGKSPAQIAKLRILDPACGSGSFLLAAYQKLIDYHARYYAERSRRRGGASASSAQARLLMESDVPYGEYKLPLEEKAAILKNNIYGVDIDPQAVEITMMSLYIKMLEGERGAIVQRHVLPPLADNIKCGNSLIDHAIDRQPDLFGELSSEDLDRIKPFNWYSEGEGFGQIMAEGGFDAVIGNPPWGADFSNQEQKFLHATYQVAQAGNIDSYAVFIERGLNRLAAKGLLSFITPDTFLRKDDHLQLRRLLFTQSSVIELLETGPVFKEVRDTWCAILVITKSKPDTNTMIRHKKLSRFIVGAEERLEKFGKGDWDVEVEVLQSVWSEKPKMVVGYLASAAAQRLITKVEKYPQLGSLTDRFLISRGEEGSKFALKEDPRGDFRIVIPEDVERYAVREGKRVSGRTLTSTKVESIYKHPKIWIIRIQKMRWKQRIVCALDDRVNTAGMKTLQTIVSATDNEDELKYLQAILASALMNFWCVNYLADDMNQSYLSKIPIRSIDSSNLEDKALRDKIVWLVDRMSKVHAELQATKSDARRTRIQREINVLDEDIDELVYELYGLTKEEIKIVEGQA